MHFISDCNADSHGPCADSWCCSVSVTRVIRNDKMKFFYVAIISLVVAHTVSTVNLLLRFDCAAFIANWDIFIPLTFLIVYNLEMVIDLFGSVCS